VRTATNGDWLLDGGFWPTPSRQDGSLDQILEWPDAIPLAILLWTTGMFGVILATLAYQAISAAYQWLQWTIL
jgi:hypothetical protein